MKEWDERRWAEVLAGVDQAEATFVSGGGLSVRTPEEVLALTIQTKRRRLARLEAERNL